VFQNASVKVHRKCRVEDSFEFEFRDKRDPLLPFCTWNRNSSSTLRQENSATDFTVLMFCVNSHQALQGRHPWNYVSTNNGEINVRIMILYDLISVLDYFWNSINEAIYCILIDKMHRVYIQNNYDEYHEFHELDRIMTWGFFRNVSDTKLWKLKWHLDTFYVQITMAAK